MTNCNFNNNEKNSSAMGIKKTQKDSKKKNSDKTNIIKEIDKVDSIDHEKKIILDYKNAIPFFFNYGKENLEILIYNFLIIHHTTAQTLFI